MISKLIIAVVSLMMPLAIFGQTTSSATSKANQQLSNSDEAFLKAIIQEDISEIGLAQMALQKSSDPQIKQYAQTKILAADPEMRDRADQIIQQSGMTPPTTPNALQESIRSELSGESGKSFDKSYMVYEASQQSADAKLMDREIKSTNNSTVKTYAKDEQTPVQQAAASAIQVNKVVASGLIHYKSPGAGD